MINMLSDPFLIYFLPIFIILFILFRVNTKLSAIISIVFMMTFGILTSILIPQYLWALPIFCCFSILILMSKAREYSNEFMFSYIDFTKNKKMSIIIVFTTFILICITAILLSLTNKDFVNDYINSSFSTFIILTVVFIVLNFSVVTFLFYEILNPIFSKSSFENVGKVKEFYTVTDAHWSVNSFRKCYCVLFEGDDTYYSVSKSNLLKFANNKGCSYKYTSNIGLFNRKFLRQAPTVLDANIEEDNIEYVFSLNNAFDFKRFLKSYLTMIISYLLFGFGIFYGLYLSNKVDFYDETVSKAQWYLCYASGIVGFIVLMITAISVRIRKNKLPKNTSKNQKLVPKISGKMINEIQKQLNQINAIEN